MLIGSVVLIAWFIVLATTKYLTRIKVSRWEEAVRFRKAKDVTPPKYVRRIRYTKA